MFIDIQKIKGWKRVEDQGLKRSPMKKSRKTIFWNRKSDERRLVPLYSATSFREPVTGSTTSCLIFSAQLYIIQTQNTYKLCIPQLEPLTVQPRQKPSSFCHPEILSQLGCSILYPSAGNWPQTNLSFGSCGDLELKLRQFNLAHIYISSSHLVNTFLVSKTTY